MNTKFSVIIPVYNTYKYINECVDSVLNQSYKNFEIILINDGSTDNSLEICRKYESQTDQIIMLTKQNEGLSATRNLGIDVSQGDYIIFLDSDDYIERDSLLKFSEIIEKTNAEVIAGYSYHVEPNGKKERGNKILYGVDGLVSGIDFFRQSLYRNSLRVAAQYYICQKNFIKRENLRFKVGIYHEDELWTPILLSKANKVVDLKYFFYNYRLGNNQSITRDLSKKNIRAVDRITVAHELSHYFSDFSGNDFDSFKDNIAAQYMYAVYDGNLINGELISVDRFFPIRHARTFKYIIKSLLFAVSPKIACKCRRMKRRK